MTTTKAQRLADTIRHWGGVTPHQVADELLRLEAQAAASLSALKATKATLERVNQERGGPIVDTIWHGPGETLFDFIDAAIQEAEGTA